LPGLLEEWPVSWREQTVVADFDEGVRQDVLQETTNELGGSDGGEFDLLGGRIFVLKSNVTSSLR